MLKVVQVKLLLEVLVLMSHTHTIDSMCLGSLQVLWRGRQEYFARTYNVLFAAVCFPLNRAATHAEDKIQLMPSSHFRLYFIYLVACTIKASLRQ